jgi:hypothetical protein
MNKETKMEGRDEKKQNAWGGAVVIWWVTLPSHLKMGQMLSGGFFIFSGWSVKVLQARTGLPRSLLRCKIQTSLQIRTLCTCFFPIICHSILSLFCWILESWLPVQTLTWEPVVLKNRFPCYQGKEGMLSGGKNKSCRNQEFLFLCNFLLFILWIYFFIIVILEVHCDIYKSSYNIS